MCAFSPFVGMCCGGGGGCHDNEELLFFRKKMILSRPSMCVFSLFAK
jgi:hypothetical protein